MTAAESQPEVRPYQQVFADLAMHCIHQEYPNVIKHMTNNFSWPSQATSYKIGMLKILELREKAKNDLGDKFDIKGFHDAVLGGGAVPLSVLERMIENWIEETKAN